MVRAADTRACGSNRTEATIVFARNQDVEILIAGQSHQGIARALENAISNSGLVEPRKERQGRD
jgi:hypothetical protein